MKRIFAACLLFLATPCSAYADEPAFELGPWHGLRMENDGGAFSHCAAINYTREDEALILAIGRDGQLAVAARSPDWKFKEGAVLMATVTVDGDLIANQIQATDKRAIRFVYTDDTEAVEAYKAISSGHVLSIRTPSGAMSFSIAGAGNVLEALLRCTKTALAQEGEPGAAATAGQASQAVRVDQSEAMVFVVNMLAAAGLTGQVYLPPSEYRDVLPDYDVVWRNADGTLGAAALFNGAAKDDMNLAATNILGGEAARCDGNFASGVRKSTEEGATASKELYTTCEADGETLETYYVIYLHDDGLLLATGTLSLTSEQNESVEQTGTAIARGLERSF